MTTLHHRGPAAALESAPAPQHGQAAPLLELRGVVKGWPRQPRRVLDGLQLALHPGERMWVGGRNGVGKTTMLRIAAGMILADRGSVTLAGLHPLRDRRAFQARVSFLSAGNSGLHARLSTRRHLDYWARLAFIGPADRAAAIEHALVTFQLRELANCRVDRMSMGQRQRLRLAGAFLHSPDVLLLDEPRNSLDDEGTAILDSATRGLTLRGAAAVVCEPTGGLGGTSADRHCVLENGMLVDQ